MKDSPNKHCHCGTKDPAKASSYRLKVKYEVPKG